MNIVSKIKQKALNRKIEGKNEKWSKVGKSGEIKKAL